MALLKRVPEPGATVAAVADASAKHEPVITTSNEAPLRKVPLTKESYWDRKEERDIQRDKDMAWSGLAQACLASNGVIQLNATNTEDGLVTLVASITDKLLRERDKRNK